jgi:hypothetical protein
VGFQRLTSAQRERAKARKGEARARFVERVKNEIHQHINVNKYYFIFYRNDGLREGLLYHDPLTAVIPKKK